MKNAQALILLLSFLFSGMSLAQERITLEDGSRLAVFVVQPAETSEIPAPLLILMGGGPGNASISRDTSIWLGGGFAERGWLVAVPVSPNNRAFRGEENNGKVEQLITEYLRIGGADQLGWADRFGETVDALTEAGVDLDAAILDSAPHMFRMNWESLDAWLGKIKN